MTPMRSLRVTVAALVAAIFAFAAPAAFAQLPVPPALQPISVAALSTNNTTGSTCALVKYAGTTAGKPTVEVAAGGDVTFKIAGSVDTTVGWNTAASSDGVFDLSTPDATIDTYGEFVNILNTQGSNWRIVLVSCLASDLTNNTITTISATDAAGPKGVALTRDAALVSATSIFSAQVALLPGAASTDIRFFTSGGPVGNTTGSTKINANPFAGLTTFVQHFRENITSTGVIALLEVLGVQRSYDGNGKVSEVVRTLYSETGAATTVEKVVNVHAGPIVTAPGEMVVVRQRTATDLTAQIVGGNGYAVR